MKYHEPVQHAEEALVSTLVARLSDRARTMPAQELAAMTRDDLAGPGLYAWWVDDVGAAELSAGLGMSVRPGLTYAGQAGATRWPSGRRSTNTLHDRLLKMHLDGRMRFSTFRRTLAAALGVPADDAGEGRLTAWMHRHLSAVVAGDLDPDSLGRVEGAVLKHLDPPLNLKGMQPSPVRAALTQRRRGTTRTR